MLTKIVPAEWKTITEYEICFDDGANNGFGFPCDKDGNLLHCVPDCAKENFAWCKEHPEKFTRFNKIVRFDRKYREPAHGTCSCGRELTLYDEYCGACSCECGKWYNLFGQELLPPDQWEDDPSDSDAWDGYEPYGYY